MAIDPALKALQDADEEDAALVALKAESAASQLPKPTLREAKDPRPNVGYPATAAASIMEDYPVVGGFAGEINALGSAAKNSLRNLSGAKPVDTASFWDKYRDERGLFDKGVKEVREANPKTSLGFGVATQLGVPIPGLGKGTALMKVGKMAALGGLEALGRGDADLTEGEFGKAALEVGGGASIGGLMQAGLNKLGSSGKATAFREWLQKRASKAKVDQLNASGDLVSEGIASARGALGGKTAEANRTMDVLMEAMDSADPEIAARAKVFIESPAGVALKKQIHLNYLDSAPTKMHAIEKAQAALAEQNLRNPAKEAEDYLAQSTIKNDVLPRAKTYLERTVPAAFGAYTGGLGGAVVGGIAGMALGKPTTAVGNMMKNPRFRLRTAQAGEWPLKAIEGVADFTENRFSGALGEEAGKLGTSFDDYLNGVRQKPTKEQATDYFRSSGGNF